MCSKCAGRAPVELPHKRKTLEEETAGAVKRRKLDQPVLAKVAGQGLLGGVETGGTTCVVSISRAHPTAVLEKVSIPTTTPNETFDRCVSVLKKFDVSAVGVAAFGPLDLDHRSPTFGCVMETPKKDWSRCDVLAPFRHLNVPVAINTDVAAAALGELVHGGHGDISSCVYITVGTGVGVGVVSNHTSVYGIAHPEGGHMRVTRHEHDSYSGNCPFHRDCVEGLTNAQAVAERANIPTSKLRELPDNHPVWELEAYYLAQLCHNITLLVVPHVIVMGGGVMQRKILFTLIHKHFQRVMAGYMHPKRVRDEPSLFIVPSVHDARDSMAGTIGALELARVALVNRKEQQQHLHHAV